MTRKIIFKKLNEKLNVVRKHSLGAVLKITVAHLYAKIDLQHGLFILRLIEAIAYLRKKQKEKLNKN